MFQKLIKKCISLLISTQWTKQKDASLETFIARKRERNKQLNFIEQRPFWDYVKWNRGHV